MAPLCKSTSSDVSRDTPYNRNPTYIAAADMQMPNPPPTAPVVVPVASVSASTGANALLAPNAPPPAINPLTPSNQTLPSNNFVVGTNSSIKYLLASSSTTCNILNRLLSQERNEENIAQLTSTIQYNIDIMAAIDSLIRVQSSALKPKIPNTILAGTSRRVEQEM